MLFVSGIAAFGTAEAQSSSLADAIASFRGGLEISVDGNSWGQSKTVVLSAKRCSPATSSPCAHGTPPLVIEIRFPAIQNAVDGSRILAQLGESGSPTSHYYIRPVPANAAGTVCATGFNVPNPLANMRVSINLGDAGTPLPVTCRWSALAGVTNPKSPTGFDLVWSDTVTVHVVGKQ
jgi:hypothetical protein